MLSYGSIFYEGFIPCFIIKHSQNKVYEGFECFTSFKLADKINYYFLTNLFFYEDFDLFYHNTFGKCILRRFKLIFYPIFFTENSNIVILPIRFSAIVLTFFYHKILTEIVSAKVLSLFLLYSLRRKNEILLFYWSFFLRRFWPFLSLNLRWTFFYEDFEVISTLFPSQKISNIVVLLIYFAAKVLIYLSYNLRRIKSAKVLFLIFSLVFAEK